MDLHDTNDYYSDRGSIVMKIIRVPGGWVYKLYGYLEDENTAISACFVPYKDSLQALGEVEK